ncbi:MAG: hypothetical protein M1829_003580, partial [Trizodia sp. TS-e1964]
MAQNSSSGPDLENSGLGIAETESFRTHRPRSSGGFLLETPYSLSRKNKSPSPVRRSTAAQRLDPKGKGKYRAQTEDERSPPRHSSQHGHPFISDSSHRPSLVPEQKPGIASSSKAHASPRYQDHGTSSDISPVQKPTNAPRQAKSDEGLDTDPVKIVNLALNLSESRRRGANSSRLSPLPAPSQVRGTSSGLPSSLDDSTLRKGSLRYHLQQQRKSSRNISPSQGRSSRATTTSPQPAAEWATLTNRFSSPQHSTEHSDNFSYEFSSSTLARAQKAKTSIELSAEFRDLLDYLPPLTPRGDGSLYYKSSLRQDFATYSKSETSSTSVLRASGRSYNPLQYIRNRKVRFRERKTINEDEIESWENISQVRAWVKRVKESAPASYSNTGFTLQLPAFPLSDEGNSDTGASPSHQHKKANSISSKPPKRPRIDWLTSPAALFADAYWLEIPENKELIEDRNGVKLYPAERSRKSSCSSVTDSKHRRDLSERPGYLDGRQWSMSERSPKKTHAPISKREIARVRTLLLSSGVKANEIFRRAKEARNPQNSPFLKSFPEITLPSVPVYQEHMLAAKMLSAEINKNNRLLEAEVDASAESPIKSLYHQISTLQEHIASKLGPLARLSADEADALAIEVTTTHTLAVKQLNDSIDTMARRRRRRFRWVRRASFVALEWMLLGIMWWVWLVVVNIRIIRATAHGVVRG